jgi:Ser/Thr protein kinase RdoA (MazF antagonist)
VPSAADGEAALALVDDLLGGYRREVVTAVVRAARATTAELAADPHAAGLVHGDLHPENVLFRGGAAGAIDFDDCGWGFLLYDLAVTSFELTGHARESRLREALLDEYARLRPLPPRVEEHLAAFRGLRILQFACWVMESREHAAFESAWRGWARGCLDDLARLGSAA